MDFSSPAFWLALGQIIWINIILSGDNAVVIALAARSLPPQQQKQAVMYGSGAAVALRIALTLVAAYLLTMPYLQIIGGLLLLWIGVQLLSEEEEGEGGARPNTGMLAAVRTILIADLVMSLDNVIAVALAAKIDGAVNYPLLIAGLAISIPLVIFGSTLMIKLMDRFPIIISLGAGLIGWVAGDAMVHDEALKTLFAGNPVAAYGVKIATAAFVLIVGKWLSSRSNREHAEGRPVEQKTGG
ncbi:MAG TPA: TerC family protein [Burkholderiales bacterium]|nr:TerC family protein [Burkholderiales bacterium]